MNTRDTALDESLGLNCAWYADVLATLTTDHIPTREIDPAGMSTPSER